MKNKRNNLIVKIVFQTILVFSFGIFGFAKTSEAKDLYVSTTGNDSVTYANNDIDHPWLTPAKGWYNAQAGDTVYFRGGTYNITSMINTNAPNGYDGTEINPITFTTYPSEAVIFNATAGSGSAMFQISKNYNIVKNFIIDGNGYFSHIFAVGWYDGDRAVTGFEADGLTISDWGFGDNANAFYVGSDYSEVMATKITIKNCTLAGNPAGTDQNYSGIQVFGATEFSIENNDVSQAINGIFIKHSSYGYADHNDVIKNNYIHDMNSGYNATLRVLGNYVDVMNNLCIGNSSFGEDAESGNNPNGNYIYFSHNTFVGNLEQLHDTGGIHPTYLNNIFTNFLYAFRYSLDPENPQIDETDYNLYNTSAVTHHGNSYSLATWKTHLVSDNTGGSRDAHSISGTPTFVGGASPSTIAGFALTSESYGYQACADSSDMGADISLVGVDAGEESDTTPPSAPSGLSVS